MDVSVQVLTTGFWPNYRAIRVTLPPLMASARDLFMKYYRSKNTHKKISWAYALGTALVRGNFARSYDFQVHTLQAVALLAINEAPGQRLSFKGLQESTGMEEDVLKRVCHSLSCAKYKVSPMCRSAVCRPRGPTGAVRAAGAKEIAFLQGCHS